MNNIEYNYSIENDALLRNKIIPQEEDGIYIVEKTPIITREVFVECYNRWIKGENAE